MVSNATIRVEKLSKRYRIVQRKERHDTLADQVTAGLKGLFRRRGQSEQERDDQVFWALRDVSFEVGAGEVIGIIGHNGAGKSTLLKILSRITEPTLGRAQIYGRIGSLLEVGTGFHPELTGRENIFLSGAIIGMRKHEIRQRFDAIVEFAGISKFLETPVKRYSSGMYVRLGFAVAAHLDPDILLVDEVLAVGDAAFQKKCLDKIVETARGGRTVIFISHNMVAVNSLCQRVLWMSGGRVVQDGPSAEVVTRYLSSTLQGTEATEEVWEQEAKAPGNDIVRLHRIRVLHQDGRQGEPLTMQTPFQVEVEYWNLLPDAHLHITLHVYNAEGVIVFTTGKINNAPFRTGLFRSVCYIPGDLLNSGPHRLVALVVKDTSTVIYSHESSVTFTILDLRERQGAYFGREPGVVQPILQWATLYLGTESGGGSLALQQVS